MISEPQIGELVKVLWSDAHGSAANVTYNIDEIPHVPIKVISYGILLKKNDVGVSIASEKCDTDCWRGYSFVPAGMLIKVETVKRSRQRKSKKINVETEGIKSEKVD